MEGVFLILLIAMAVCFVMAGREWGITVGRDIGQKDIQQQAVDQGYGFWTVVAAVNVFQWGQPEEFDNDDTPPNADSSPAASSSDGGPIREH